MSPSDGAFNPENQHHSWDRVALTYETAAGGSLTTYYVNDLTRSQTQDGITNTYELDAMHRQRERVRTGGSEAGTEIYHYAGGSDSPAWVDKGEGNWTRFIGGLGAMAIEDSATEDVTLQLSDLHGDIVATADNDPEATELLSTQQFDEYGNPKAETTPKLGWLGSKLRRTELPSGVIQMGVRSYVPALGRFLSPDPILGGSANAYEYAMGDPVNKFDLTGECVRRGRHCAKGSNKWARRAARRANKRRAIVIRIKNKRVARHFYDNLKSRPLFLEKLEKNVGRWRAADIREMHRGLKLARREARRDAAAPNNDPSTCEVFAVGTGLLALASKSVVFGASSTALGILGSADSC